MAKKPEPKPEPKKELTPSQARTLLEIEEGKLKLAALNANFVPAPKKEPEKVLTKADVVQPATPAVPAAPQPMQTTVEAFKPE